MSDRQYDQARRDLVQKMQDILDSASPITVNVFDESDIDKDSDDEPLPATENLITIWQTKNCVHWKHLNAQNIGPNLSSRTGRCLWGHTKGV